jgi:hypothetical protein
MIDLFRGLEDFRFLKIGGKIHKKIYYNFTIILTNRGAVTH